MKKFLFFLLVCAAMTANATKYYRIEKFPIDGATVRDTFLVVTEYANNTYIWDGQNDALPNSVVLQNYSSDVISGNYADNEVALYHNQYHGYNKQFSFLSKGDGDRDDKGGYYLSGVKNNNGIEFHDGQVNVEIGYENNTIRIFTLSGAASYFRFNITPNDPHGYKFYRNDQNMLYPTLYVKGANPRYTTATDVEAVSNQEVASKKVFRNGQLYILRDGEMYNAQGTRVE